MGRGSPRRSPRLAAARRRTAACRAAFPRPTRDGPRHAATSRAPRAGSQRGARARSGSGRSPGRESSRDSTRHASDRWSHGASPAARLGSVPATGAPAIHADDAGGACSTSSGTLHRSLRMSPATPVRALHPRRRLTTLPPRDRSGRDTMSDTKSHAAIDSVLREERVFPPPPEFSRHAHVPDRARYDALYQWSVDDPEGFWREMAGRLRWMTPFKRVLEWQPPFAQ